MYRQCMRDQAAPPSNGVIIWYPRAKERSSKPQPHHIIGNLAEAWVLVWLKTHLVSIATSKMPASVYEVIKYWSFSTLLFCAFSRCAAPQVLLSGTALDNYSGYKIKIRLPLNNLRLWGSSYTTCVLNMIQNSLCSFYRRFPFIWSHNALPPLVSMWGYLDTIQSI